MKIINTIKAASPIYTLTLITIITLSDIQGETRIAQDKVTWTFEGEHTTGQFINGDPWIVGPAKLILITPSQGEARGGSMINPSVNGQQGFDDRIKGVRYDAKLNINENLPLYIDYPASVLTSISLMDDAIRDDPQLETVRILTILLTEPAENAFRPPYQGTDKSILGTMEDIDLSRLRNVAKTDLSVPITDFYEKTKLPWIELNTWWTGRYMHPKENQPTYGREIASLLSIAFVTLQEDYSVDEKLPLAINLTQIGLDIYGAARIGGAWDADGGHNYGRKLPLLFAATTLNSQTIKEYGDATKHMIFQEDQQTFIVSQVDVDRTLKAVNGAPTLQYEQSDIGMAEWGFKHTYSPNYDNKDWETPYRVMFSSVIGAAASATAMDMQSEWNHPPFFEFAVRYVQTANMNVGYGVNNFHPRVAEFWNKLNDTKLPPDPSALKAKHPVNYSQPNE